MSPGTKRELPFPVALRADSRQECAAEQRADPSLERIRESSLMVPQLGETGKGFLEEEG